MYEERQKPRERLLNLIISASGIYNQKYSMAFKWLTAVMRLETADSSRERLPKEFFDEYEQIKTNSTKLAPELEGMPIHIVEEYFFRKHKQGLNFEVYIENSQGQGSQWKVQDMYTMLEDFFDRIFFLAVRIADFYSLEIKLKRPNSDEEDVF